MNAPSRLRRAPLVMLAVLLGGAALTAQGTPGAELPLDFPLLQRVRERLAAGDPALAAAAARLRADATARLDRGPYSVVDKQQIPPSGDKHDYMSVGPYWWPNPDTDDGLPYVRRDGDSNPQRRDIPDAGNWGKSPARAFELFVAVAPRFPDDAFAAALATIGPRPKDDLLRLLQPTGR